MVCRHRVPPDGRYGGRPILPGRVSYRAPRGDGKSQVDGYAGRPSCAVGGYLARSAVSIADGRWHDVMCERSDGWLTISVDGVPRGRVAVPAAAAIGNDLPLRIGGKGLAA